MSVPLLDGVLESLRGLGMHAPALRGVAQVVLGALQQPGVRVEQTMATCVPQDRMWLQESMQDCEAGRWPVTNAPLGVVQLR